MGRGTAFIFILLLGGLVAPVLWSGLVHSLMELINPILDHRVDWLWFVLSQVGFGLVAGFVVSRQQRIRTIQHFPFALRAGFEVSGSLNEDETNDDINEDESDGGAVQ